MWDIIDTGISSAEANMQKDADLLETLDEAKNPIIHFYDWEGDCATYGYFVDPAEYLQLDKVREKKLHLAKRPTGGGIIFHLWDFAFSVLVPASSPHFSENTLDNYSFVNKAVLEAIGDFMRTKEKLQIIERDLTSFDRQSERFCMARPTKYDVVYAGKKIAGAAQRKTKKGFLHQGSISMVLPCREYLKEVLQPKTQVLDAIFSFSAAILCKDATKSHVSEAKRDLRLLLHKHLSKE